MTIEGQPEDPEASIRRQIDEMAANDPDTRIRVLVLGNDYERAQAYFLGCITTEESGFPIDPESGQPVIRLEKLRELGYSVMNLPPKDATQE